MKDVIKNNFKVIKQNCTAKKICAVVKADAYGIGVQNIVNQIDDDIDFYAVACFMEAEKLKSLTKKPILVLNFVPKNSIKLCIENNISITIGSIEQVKVLQKYFKDNIDAFQKHKKLKIHFAINSGMNRIGFCNEKEFLQTLQIIDNLKDNVFIEGIFTHFFDAENFKETKKQICIFNHFVKLLSVNFDISKIIKHACNSLGAIKYKQYNFDMVRVGIALYGNLDAKKQKSKSVKNVKQNLNDVINLHSKIINIENVKKGQFVGYGKNYIVQKDMVVGTVPLGYADGIFRSYAKNGKVICKGKYCKILGNICMDMFMIDLTNVKAKLFDKVIIIGTDNFGNKVSINDFAKKCGTISYEILTSIKQNRFNIKTKKF